MIRPLYAEGLKALARMSPSWEPNTLPHLAIGFYHLIFGYFASAPLLEAATDTDPTSPAAVRRQQAFLRTALNRLMTGTDEPPATAARPRRTRRRR